MEKQCVDCGNSGTKMCFQCASNNYLWKPKLKDASEIDENSITKYTSFKKPEYIKHPKHYNQGKYEPIDVIKDWKLDFNLGNVLKYIARCEYKNNKLQDLKKAKEYLEHEIKSIEDTLCK